MELDINEVCLVMTIVCEHSVKVRIGNATLKTDEQKHYITCRLNAKIQ